MIIAAIPHCVRLTVDHASSRTPQMISPYQSQRKPRDHHILFAVRFEDGRSAYIRVSPTVAEAGDLMAIAREQQERGEIPVGNIAGVKRVR